MGILSHGVFGRRKIFFLLFSKKNLQRTNPMKLTAMRLEKLTAIGLNKQNLQKKNLGKLAVRIMKKMSQSTTKRKSRKFQFR